MSKEAPAVCAYWKRGIALYGEVGACNPNPYRTYHIDNGHLIACCDNHKQIVKNWIKEISEEEFICASVTHDYQELHHQVLLSNIWGS